ncbi:MAG: formimidoylglutamase [Ferruginibacter sp.]|nr:formimidoylglutamase [Cytophagales bacterium]
MDLTIFFDSLDEDLFGPMHDPSVWYAFVDIHTGRMPNWKNAHFALVGVGEGRGSANNAGCAKAPDEIRKRLYRLKRGAHSYRVADLGNLRPGITVEETQLRLREVGEVLLRNHVIPVILGGSHDLDYGQFRAYQGLEKLVSVLVVDATLDLHPRHAVHASEYHVQQILLHEPNYLFNYSHLAYQSYLVSPDALAVLESLQFDAHRIGQMRENFKEVEPVVRYADMVSFDVTAIRQTDAPGNANAQPFGLTGEEACQICWYAGLNGKMTSAGFYEYNPDLDLRGQTAAVVATMVWYLVEGFYHRRPEADFTATPYTRYVVAVLDDHSPNLVFYKSNRSEKWWMEVPYPNEPQKHCIVPCSYEDYRTANQGELPQRWINTYAKLG